MKMMCLFAILLASSSAYAQEQPGVNCSPIQGQGWSGCVPNYQQQQQSQQPQAPQLSTQTWVDHWGAIATYEPNGSLGVANNMTSQGEAESAALEDCQSKYGSTCKLETSYRNGCGALIGSTTGYVVTSKATLNETIQTGMLTCTKAGYSNCHVYYSGCSLPMQIH